MDRKAHYSPQGPQEAFIVPLLGRAIDETLFVLADSLRKNRGTQLVALDCGCGNQPFRQSIESLGFLYQSLDISQNSLANVDYICRLDERSEVFSKIVSQQFDLVIATEVLEHIPNWNDAFRNLHQSLKEGGYVLLTAPFFFPLHEEPYDFFRPTPYLFEKMAVANGFSVVKIQKLGTAVDIIGTVLGADRITLINPSTIFDTFIVKALNLIQLILFSILVRFRKKLTSCSDSLYLSNLVVFRKV